LLLCINGVVGGCKKLENIKCMLIKFLIVMNYFHSYLIEVC
jgi:hypothetical protein